MPSSGVSVRFLRGAWFPLALGGAVVEVPVWRGSCPAELTQRASPQSNAAITGFAGVRMVHSVMQNSPDGEITVVQGPGQGKKRGWQEAACHPGLSFRAVIPRRRSDRVAGEILVANRGASSENC